MAKKNRLLDLSDEEMERLKQRRLNGIKKLSLAFQLGTYVGEEIVNRYLPTLSVDMIQSNRVIKVSQEEEEECQRLDDAWFETMESRLNSNTEDIAADSPEWKRLREYHKELEKKYLPETVECFLAPINCEDELELKRGIVHALWHSDMSHYKCSKPEDVDVKLTDDAFFTMITIKRD